MAKSRAAHGDTIYNPMPPQVERPRYVFGPIQQFDNLVIICSYQSISFILVIVRVSPSNATIGSLNENRVISQRELYRRQGGYLLAYRQVRKDSSPASQEPRSNDCQVEVEFNVLLSSCVAWSPRRIAI